MRQALLPLALAACAAAVPAHAASSPQSSCVACHSDPARASKSSLGIARLNRRGAHARVGILCHDCHGGNPDPALAGNMDAAMDPAYRKNPYRGEVKAARVPELCGRCHSDPDFMKRFDPGARTDQQQQYWTSHHGKALRAGDSKVATCSSCHGAHGILPPGNAGSSVHPTRVAATCASCHSDPRRMSGYRLPSGKPLPIDQRARWERSVHADALLRRENLSAPTCNDCHGDHGATPPGVESVALVCGRCHRREADLFRRSPKAAGFQRHQQLMAEAGKEGCRACHRPPSPAAGFDPPHSLTECEACHGNHAVLRPTLAMLGPLPESACVFCHEAPGPLAEAVPEPREKARHYQQVKARLLRGTERMGKEERFNWLADQALQLEPHMVAGGHRGEKDGRRLRPEFERLWQKFRIGKTYFSYRDPTSGKSVPGRIIRCTDCHEVKPGAAEQPPGTRATLQMVRSMRELTAVTARAERIVLAARRGGVELAEAPAFIEKAVDAEIALAALVHAFQVGKGSELGVRQAEGLAHARQALQAGQSALEELSTRRHGLYVSLAVILLFLFALAMKIRHLPARR